MSQPISFLDPYISTRTSVHVLGGLFFLTAAVSWTAVGVDFAQLRLASEIGAGVDIESARKLAHSHSTSLVAGSQIVCAIVTGIAFLVWLYRVRVNVRALGMRRMRYGRAWTVLGFVVPFLNALRPYQVVSEIWKASDPASSDPVGWRVSRVPRLLISWWGAFVAYVVLEVLSALVLDLAIATTTRQMGYALGLLADVSAAVSASLAYFVVARISEAQEAKREQWGAGPAAVNVGLDSRGLTAT